MHIINQSSADIDVPVPISAFLGFVSMNKQSKVFRPELEMYLKELRRKISKKDCLKREDEIKQRPDSYIDTFLYEAGIIYVPNNLHSKEKRFVLINCHHELCAEEKILEQLKKATQQVPNKLVKIIALVEGNNYESRITSKGGILRLSNISIVDQDNEIPICQ